MAVLIPHRVVTLLSLSIIVLLPLVKPRCSSSCVCNSEKYNARCNIRNILFNVPKGIPEDIAFLQIDNLHKQSIGKGDLGKYQNLTYLHLNGGKVQVIDNLTFVDLVKLQDLDLRGNGIVNVGRDAFKGLTQLNHLILAKNRLATIEGEVFNHLTNLLHLDLSDNKLIAFPWNLKLPLLQTMYLDTNNLERLEGPNMENPFRHLTNLEVIIISNNKLTVLDIDLFKQLFLLKTLDVSRNRIFKILHATEAKTLKQLTNFRINNNKIQTFPHDFETILATMATFHHIVPWRVTLDLSANPYHCNCEMAWYRALLDDNQFQYFKNYGSCATPAYVKDLKTLSLASFKCDPPIIDRAFMIERKTANDSETVYFVCHARGNPAPTITWFSPTGFNQTQESPVNKTNYNNSAVFVVNPFMPGDSGRYLCRAGNVHGFADKHVVKQTQKLTGNKPTESTGTNTKPPDDDGDWNFDIPIETTIIAAASFGFILIAALACICCVLMRRHRERSGRQRRACCFCCRKRGKETIPLDNSGSNSPAL